MIKYNSRSMKAIETPVTKIGIVTVSDRASSGEYADRSGPAIVDYLNQVITSPFQAISRVISDDQSLIEKTLIELSDDEQCHLIVTTGGTGPAWRDVTPEATLAVCNKEMPGFGEAMRAVSLQKVPTAILSRQTAAIRNAEQRGTLIVNLPGSPKAIAECLDAVFPAIPYCIELINPSSDRILTDGERIRAFRPRQEGMRDEG